MTGEETAVFGNEVVLAHGGGGRLSLELIEAEILTRFGEGPLAGLPDGATLSLPAGRIVVSTDSFVVQPLEFPGGNIGDLSVYGTVNDVAVAGGRPQFLSLALILEEGLALGTLRRVLDSVRSAADRCGVKVATGDIKVVPAGQCDGMYINTTGLGEAVEGFNLGPDRIRPGDRVVVSGSLGDHGMAVMAARESIGVKNGPESDAGPVHRLVLSLAHLGPSVRFMRDPTRGGLAAVLHEVVRGRAFGVQLREADLPFSAAGRAVAEMLGMDLLHSASEGRVVLFCAPDASDAVTDRWRGFPEGRDAAVVGTVTDEAGRVTAETVIGTRRLVDMPQGELLPRIC